MFIRFSYTPKCLLIGNKQSKIIYGYEFPNPVGFYIGRTAADPPKKILQNHLFEVAAAHFKEMPPTSVLAVHAIPK